MDCCPGGVDIFTTPAGTAVTITSDVVPIVFAVDDDPDLFNDLNAIVTSLGINAQSGYQFMHALREFIYVYVFTERIGEIVINGLAFNNVCKPFGPQDDPGPQGGQDPGTGIQGSQGPQVPNCFSGTTGLERIITWYECNRITSRSTPITIVMGAAVVYDAFLVGMRADIVNAETGIAQFSMRFNFVPRISDEDDFCFPINEQDNCLDQPCPGLAHMDALEFNNEVEER